MHSNFVRSIVRYFHLGCDTVVLAFDDYYHVPRAKATTQANRAKAKAEYDFREGQNLQPTIPDRYNEKLIPLRVKGCSHHPEMVTKSNTYTTYQAY